METDGLTRSIINVEPIEDRWRAFGWAAERVDGHDIERIRTSIAYPRLNVKIVANNAGVEICRDGVTHQAVEDLAVGLAPYNIRVNTFAPGPTRVERNLRDDPDYDRSWGPVTPMNRTALPEEMVGAAMLLASDDSSYMTGQVFYMDGGWTLQGRIPVENLDQAMQRNR